MRLYPPPIRPYSRQTPSFTALDPIEDRFAAVLRAQPGIRHCDACLALEVQATPAEAQAAVAVLNGNPYFKVVQDNCSSCLRHKVVLWATR
jgi:hypothetical protein